MCFGAADGFKQRSSPLFGLELARVVVDDARAGEAAIVERAFDEAAIVFVAGAVGNRKSFFATHSRGTNQNEAANLLRVPGSEFDHNLSAQAAGDKVVGWSLYIVVEIVG